MVEMKSGYVSGLMAAIMFMMTTTVDAESRMCKINNSDINTALGGMGKSSISFDNGNAVLDFSKVNAQGKQMEMFQCASDSCTKTIESDGKETYKCPTLACETTCEIGSDRACTNMLSNIVGTVGSQGVTVKCDANGARCDITERMLNLYFGEVDITECESKDIESMSAKMEVMQASTGSFSNSVACNVLTPSINTYLGGKGKSAIIYNEQDNSAKLEFSKMNTNGEMYDMFSCQSARPCEIAKNSGSDIEYLCPSMSCKLDCTIGSDPACDNMLGTMIGQVGRTGMNMHCVGDECSISERLLNLYFGDVAIGECKDIEQFDLASSSSSSSSSHLISEDDLLAGDLVGFMAAHEVEAMTCAIENAAINDVLGGKGSTVLVYSEEDNSAVLDFQKLKNGEVVDMFSCDGSMCTKKEGTNGYDVVYDCPELSCTVSCEMGQDSACTRVFSNVISNVGTQGVTMACKGDKCDMSERMLNLYFGDVAISNCETDSPSMRRNLLSEDDLLAGDLVGFMAAHEVETKTCVIKNSAINGALNGKASTVLVYSNEDDSAVLGFQKENPNGEVVEMYSCDGEACSKSVAADGSIIYSCPELACSLDCEVGKDSACTNMLRNIIGNVGTQGVSIKCSESGDKCAVTERMLNLYFGDVNIEECQDSAGVSQRRNLASSYADKVEKYQTKAAKKVAKATSNSNIPNRSLYTYDMEKASTMAASDADAMSCAMTNRDVNAVLGGIGSTDFVFTEEKSSAVLEFKKTAGGVTSSMFQCDGSQCKKTILNGKETYDCPQLACSTTCEVGKDPACTNMFKNVIGNVGSRGVQLECDGDSCVITERMLNLYFGDVSVNECKSNTGRRILKAGPRATVDDPNWKKQADKWTMDYGSVSGHGYDESPPPYVANMNNGQYNDEAAKGVARAQRAVDEHTRRLRA